MEDAGMQIILSNVKRKVVINMKICPVMTGRGRCFNTIYCYKEECAWWNEETQECSIKNLSAIDKKEINIPSSVTVKQDPNDIDHYFL
jgi:hypothetical protein